jgi:soluble lytic murein transglycosylase-like protein
MQMLPGTAAEMAKKLGLDPKSVDLRDMRWAVPLAMQYLADGVNATKSGEGALGYYNSGKADPRSWNQHTRDYIEQGVKSYLNMKLKLPPAPPAPDAETTQGSP